ncbi:MULTISPECIES: hypothetical protein [unclassified Mesotoga]|jgi:hypothetical protein|uniref:hypothetical protein n=1 Tax=unclassified Mesotoga TaxID=1184398 RepID=UPI0025E6C82B|nr:MULTISPECIES: hypothetical protein [unclassified Mesotoga]
MRFVCIALVLVISASAIGIGFGVGVKIHGHFEPFAAINFDTWLLGFQAKAGVIFDTDSIVLVPGMYLYKDIASWRVHGGTEILFHLGEMEGLLLARAGASYGFATDFGELFIGAELGFPVNLPGEFFVDTSLKIVPTFLVQLEF